MAQEYFSISGINTYLNPLTQDGALIHSVNMVSFPYGAKTKRPGYGTFLGAPDNGTIQSLFSWGRQDGTTQWLYRASGSSLYYSQQGTGAWTLAGNGTIANGNHFNAAVLNDTLIGGDGAGSTRHTTNGTAFTNTTAAPVSEFFAQYAQRIFAMGTGGTVVYSSAGSADNWSNVVPADSSSFLIPDEGKPAAGFVTGDKLMITKNRGKIFTWDQFALSDLSTKFGPSSPYSIGQIEDYRLFLNQYGIYGFDRSNNVTLISNAVQRYFYNRANTGISSSLFTTIPATAHLFDYFAAIGTITDDFTGRTVNNAILNYNYQKNEFLLWQFNDNPTAFLSYKDSNQALQLIFGNGSGQCFQLDNTKTSDNGAPIASEMVFLFTYASSEVSFQNNKQSVIAGALYEEKWNWIRLLFNPGAEVNIQFAFTNTLTYQHLKWSEAISTTNRTGDFYQVSDGAVEIRFPMDQNNLPRSRFMFLRIYESSDNARYTYYGAQIDAEVQLIK